MPGLSIITLELTSILAIVIDTKVVNIEMSFFDFY